MVERDSRTFDQITRIREIEALGATVKTIAMDIAIKQDIQRLLKSLDAEEWLPIYGVVHTAAVVEDRARCQTWTSRDYRRLFTQKF